MKIKHPGRWIVLLALIGGVAGAIFWRLFQTEETKSRSNPTEQAVTVIQAKVADTALVVEVNGSVVPLKVVEVRSQISNLVKEVLIKEGQVVQQGQPMFVLDDRNDLANVEKLRAALARNRALGLDQDRQLARSRELRAQNFISQGSLDTTTAQRDAQWAQVKSDEATLAAAEVALGYNVIRAPISGRTGAINVYPGTLVQPATAALVTITQIDPIAVQFSLPESQYARLKSSHASGRAKVKATVPATSQVLEGDMYFVDNSIDPASGTIRVKASFANAKGDLWPGQFVQVSAELGVLKDALVIPPEAVVTTVNGRFVYVVGEDNTVKPNPIKDVYAHKNTLVVTGITAEDHIVLDGRQNLRPGGKVRIITPAAGSKK
ncbi:MAG: efflux RND transporter periplasmic adaptor subunit [Alphaproteobacteria bacterium]|nr:efflux RND transporter periplasmic adaptor subunit [Alphaproteobacteria bacterium]